MMNRLLFDQNRRPARRTRLSFAWLLLALLVATGSPAQVTNLFGENSPPTELPNPTSLSTEWYQYLTKAEPDARADNAGQLLTHVRALAEAIPDEALRASLTRDIDALENALDEWLDAQAQVPSPVELPLETETEVTLSAYLQLGGQRDQTRSRIQAARRSQENLERNIRELTGNLDALNRDYRTAEATSPARFRLGIQRMTARLLVLSAELNLQNTQAEINRLDRQLLEQNAALMALSGELQPRSDTGVTPADCPQQSASSPASLPQQADEMYRNCCLIANRLLDDWEQMAEAELIPDELLETIDLQRAELNDIQARLPILRNDLEQRLLVRASTETGTGTTAELSLEQIRKALEQLVRADDQLSRANLLVTLIDEQQLQGAGSLERFWHDLKGFSAGAWQRIYRILKFRLFAIGESIVTPLSILRVLLIVWLGWWISRIFRVTVNRFSRHRFAGGESAAWYTLSRIGHYIIVIAAVLIGLASIGLDLSNLAIIAGALSVGVGFGLQSIVSNFVSGLILLFERSIKIGDYVDLEGGITGQVRAINTRFTRINTNDNIDILVPNSELVSNRLINWTMHEAMRRLHIPFGVAYGSDKDMVQKAALEAADQVSYTVKDYPNRDPEVWLVEFGDSSLNFELLVWLRDGVKRPARVMALYLWELETALKKYDIEIPFPQRDLHLRTGFDKPYFDTGAGNKAVQKTGNLAEPDNT